MCRKGSFTSDIQTSKMEQITEFTKNWALMDVEYIQTSSTHRCIRKIYLLMKDGSTDLEMEFYPCTQYKKLESRYQRAFRFCRNHIHRLSYNPKKYSPLCSNVVAYINNFIVNNDIDMILYKGGTIEKDLCRELYIPSKNIECIPDLEKIQSHDPRVETNWYYEQIIGYCYL